MHLGFSPYYKGPKSDHFDGTRFFNPWAPIRHNWLNFLRWSFTSRPKPWPNRVENPSFDQPPACVEGNDLRVSFVGHSSTLLQTQGLNILTDPIWAEWSSPFRLGRAKRIAKPGIHIEHLPKIDIILLSHNHYDHMDAEFLRNIGKRDAPRLFTPLGNDVIIKGIEPSLHIEPMDWEDSKRVHDGVTLHLQPSQHWSARFPWDFNKALWGAFVIETKGGNIYFAGDTGFGTGEHFLKAKEKFGGFRFAILPIGAYEPRWFMRYVHMAPDESAKAHKLLGDPYSLAVHYGTFRLSDEGYDEPQEALQAAKNLYGIPSERFHTLNIGESWFVPNI